jgi:P4 family phage/plasmid primase-like protien
VSGIHEEQALLALKFRYRDVPEGATIAVSTADSNDANFRTKLFRTDELERIATMYAGTTSNVWTRLSVLRGDVELEGGSRGLESDTLGTAIAHIDLDPSPVEGETYDEWRVRALVELQAFYPRPSGIEDSGRGYYAFWRIPFTEDWRRVKRINRWLARQLGGDHCFTKGHRILLADKRQGLMIEQLKVGTWVLGYNEAAGKTEPTQVVETHERQATGFLRIYTANGRIVRCTPEHPFFVKNQWTPARELKIGDEIHELRKVRQHNPAGICGLCGEWVPALEHDHKVAFCDGGLNDVANTQWICGTCHLTKSNEEKSRAAKRRDTPENREQRRQWSKAAWDALTPVEREERGRQSTITTRNWHANATEEEKKAWRAKISAGRLKVTNGDPIVSIQDDDSTATVYNITCAPHANYFVRGLLVHNCYDVSRILRLPGTLNPKDGVMRFAEIISHSDDPPYALDNFGEADLDALEQQVDEEGHVAAEPLPLDVDRRIAATTEKLWDRIRDEAGARSAGAELRSDREHVDRSRNDLTIAIQLLRLGLTPGQVYSVLTHTTWFSGEKFRETGYSESYAQTTLKRATSVVGEQEQTNPVEIARKLLDSEYLLNYLQEWFRYSPDTGVYEPADRWLAEYCQDVAGLKWHPTITSTVKEWLYERTKLERKNQPSLDALTCVANGMLEWRTGRLLDHSPGYKALGGINAVWDQEVDCSDVDEFVGNILKAEDIPTWWMAVGYCLYVETPLPYRLLLAIIGPKATGKSTALKAQMLFLGEHNCSTVSLEALSSTGDKFVTSQLIGKLLNVDFDAPYDRAVRSTHLLKKLASGDPIMVEKKGKDAETAALPVKMMFAMNEDPVAEGGDEGYYDRWRVLRVRDDHRFDAKNPNRKVNAEIRLLAQPRNRSAWLLRAVQGLRELSRLGEFPENRKAKQEFRFQSDSIYRWWMTQVDTMSVTSVDASGTQWTPISKFFPHYQAWCQEENQVAQSMRAFSIRSRSLIQEGVLAEAYVRHDSAKQLWTVAGRQPRSRGVRLAGQLISQSDN